MFQAKVLLTKWIICLLYNYYLFGTQLLPDISVTQCSRGLLIYRKLLNMAQQIWINVFHIFADHWTICWPIIKSEVNFSIYYKYLPLVRNAKNLAVLLMETVSLDCSPSPFKQSNAKVRFSHFNYFILTSGSPLREGGKAEGYKDKRLEGSKGKHKCENPCIFQVD